ncbi:phosphoglycerate kinase [Candidatus Bathyarchaeota archaeon ex4484_205]|nr:MAG: phosphoglycerate kinase [Candidatus Bathyarchaeota archaeon ex4484_205]
MKLGFLTLDDVDVKGKRVLLRVDINSPLDKETLEITDDTRIKEHSRTIKELMDKGAKTIILAHQGQKGKWDFTPLAQHASVLSQILGYKVTFVPSVIGPIVPEAINEIDEGDVIMLDNVRNLDDEAVNKSPEEHAESSIVKFLTPYADIFVNDAFSAAHRSHASIVGFTVTLPSYAGRVMERELEALSRATENPEKPCTYIIGGAKPKGSLDVIDHVLSSGIADHVLIGGVVAILFLHAHGVDVGSANLRILEDTGFMKLVNKAEMLLREHKDAIVLPQDVAVGKDGERLEVNTSDLPVEFPIRDIGSKTIEEYSNLLNSSSTVVINGPMGMYEVEAFEVGTREVFKAASKCRGFTLVGGGHSSAAVKRFGLADSFSYVSSAGGALLNFLAGKKLPAVEALRAAAKRHP